MSLIKVLPTSVTLPFREGNLKFLPHRVKQLFKTSLTNTYQLELENPETHNGSLHLRTVRVFTTQTSYLLIKEAGLKNPSSMETIACLIQKQGLKIEMWTTWLNDTQEASEIM